ncbi:CheB methylesterase [Tolypothrix tenuis PCC 7101]|uniref:protein-glutamate methylesterase n=1 Tax=Tolypothrix tenuis PCC 7101 TaxID=231146 RepID=A0A1Z4MS16_9CYAN|nr:chemotaxis protein CheB [Aulosira sp. FACHB-113]BAY96258.1 CheB methylesterase [Tolypothrix tenuis PCC 7101]BAZ73235.1 CheB methylesterase [Aulosira laxa NIES-50]
MADSEKQTIVRDIIVVGTSAGGVEALTELVKYLPPNLNASVIIVLHLPSHSPNVLADILNRGSRLPVFLAQDGQAIEKGHIYVAPSDRHLLVKAGYLQLWQGPKENGSRPAIDPLFRTAARAYGQRLVAVLLTGLLDDGTAGLMAVKMRDGVAIVQRPDDALYAAMPSNAIANVDGIDYILPLSEIPSTLAKLANTPKEEEPEKPVTREMELESEMANFDIEELESDAIPGNPSPFTCPDCGGSLWEIEDGKLLRFRCHVGHAFSAKTLLTKQSDKLEDALWIAVRALQEKATLADRMASRMRDRNLSLAAKRLQQQSEDAQQQSEIIQEVLKMLNGKSAEST